MATSLTEDFESWLSSKLKSLNTDEGVFGSYITGILTGDETLEEKTEALEGILAEISGSDISRLCSDILDKWKECSSGLESESSINEGPTEDVEEKLVRLLEKNTLSQPVQREYTEEERKIREAILSQYAETSDQEEDEDVEEEVGKENGLVRNTNVSSVVQAEKEKREKAKIDSQKKKEKDKEDRERQKQQQQEKKEKRKTQKGERRR